MSIGNAGHRQTIIIHKYSLSQNPPSIDPNPNHTPNVLPVVLNTPLKRVPISKVHNSLKCNKHRPDTLIPSFTLQRQTLDGFTNRKIRQNQLSLQDRSHRMHTQVRKHSIAKNRKLQRSATRDKVVKIFLPNLKKFDDFDYESDKISPLNRAKMITEITQTMENKQTQFQTPQRVKLNDNTKNLMIQQQGRTPVNNFSSEAKKGPKIYKYIENTPVSQNPKSKRSPTQQQDSNLSVSSYSPNFAKQTHIVFHHFKSKKTIQTTRSSILSEKLLDLEKIKKNLNEFILNYQPMDPHFDLKEFIRDPEVEIVSNDRMVFAGKIIDGKMEGKGILITQKEIFEGQFANNLKSQGFERNKNGLYEGTYQDGQRSGFGKFIWKNNETYEGEWRNGRKNGHGVWRSPKGNYYQGQWKENLQNGKGIYFHKGCSIYRGYFKNSLKHGRGEEELENKDKYQGQYKMGKPHGYGKYTWGNGDTYEGDFSEGSRSGVGILRKFNGQRYEGSFKDDMKEGLGKQIYLKGQYFEGHFEKGLKVSGKYYSSDGKVLKVC